MGNLPKHRVTLERPFFSCGIDYAGPVLIKCNKGRGTKSTNGYIALFVCLASKAVHIEAVGDLTTDSFIAALRRFSARRGAPRHIYSDNGTNFVGARRKLDEIRKLWLSLPTNEAISYYLSKSSIDWHFILFSSPHFGGDVLSVPEELPSTSNHRDVAAVAEWYGYRTVAYFVTGSSPVPLKTRRVGQRCTLNLSRAETSSRWCGVVVRRGGASSGVVHVT
ncbi:hypothetical protein TNCV_3401361 [Trichonephila clavipes]|nr:hypothetical protein TNCV_3401361 [Trichonephila clavipes]